MNKHEVIGEFEWGSDMFSPKIVKEYSLAMLRKEFWFNVSKESYMKVTIPIYKRYDYLE